MSTSIAHHHFRWLNLLTRHLGISTGHSSPVEQPDTNNQSELYIEPALAQAARGTTIVHEEALHQAAEATISVTPTARFIAASASAERISIPSAPSASSSLIKDLDQSAAEHEHLMHCKKVRLIMNPRVGHNFTRIADVLAVFSAAGWKTDMTVKLHGRHAMELATKAAEDGYDLVLVFGGDETLNQVVNGLMAANGKRQPGIVGVLPGGTAHQWVTETSEFLDPVKAALSLIGSEVGTVDLGHIQVQALKFPNVNQGDHVEPRFIEAKKDRKAQKRKAKQPAGVENYFLLTAGLRIDAAEVLPEKHAFPIEIASIEADGQDATTLWSGEAFQVILGNTHRHADVVETASDDYRDDGKLDLCVITEGNTLATLEQMLSFLFRHKPDSNTARNFQGAHFLITVPATIHLQLDGTSVQLEDYLSKADRKALQQVSDRAQVMVSYRFDAVSHALRVALPQANTLSEHSSYAEETYTADAQRADRSAVGGIGAINRPLGEQHDEQREQAQRESSDLIKILLEDGYEVTITDVVMVPGKRQRYVIAGQTDKQGAGKTKRVAIRIDEDATVLWQAGEHVPHANILELQEGSKVTVVGKKNKRGILKAKQVTLLR